MNKIQIENTKNTFNKNVGKLKGLEIWYIEKLEPVPYPRKEYGKFYSGSAFIVLNTKDINGVLYHDIHFWLGKETTEDEAGSAAMLTVYLDEYLGEGPVQHREVQDHELGLFLSYFKKGIRYVDGGFDIKKVSNADGMKRLFHVSRRHTSSPRIRQVALTIKSMNKDDFFILDCGRKIFVYTPMDALKQNIIRTNEIAQQIRDQDHNGRSTVHILDHPISLEDRIEFFGALGCSSNNPELPDASRNYFDDIEMKENATVTLYNVFAKPGILNLCAYTSGLLRMCTQPLNRDMLQTEGCYILDAECVIFVWVGKKVAVVNKSLALLKAQEFLAKLKYPSWTPIQKVTEGSESVQFKQYFATWRETNLLTVQHKIKNGKDSIEFDPIALHSRKKSGKGGFMPDGDGKGLVVAWRVMYRNIVMVREEMRGMFFEENCYLIKYYPQQKKSSVVYFWQGKNASELDKGMAGSVIADAVRSMIGDPIQVLVYQGYEPLHFLKIFKGKFIILFGSHEVFLRIKNSNIKSTGIELYKIRGTSEDNVHAEQMNPVASSLASDDTFILKTFTTTYVWNGKGTSEFENKMAKDNVDRLSPGSTPIIIQENFEPPAFWKALGGKGDYDRDLDKAGAPYLDTRLFHCKVLDDGKFVVKEIFNFFQDDLDIDDVFILDGGDEIYVWEGKDCSEEEREKSMQLTYIKTEPSARTPESVPIITIKQDNEPRSFKQLFPKWKNNFWK